jgi:hypothetical protein
MVENQRILEDIIERFDRGSKISVKGLTQDYEINTSRSSRLLKKLENCFPNYIIKVGDIHKGNRNLKFKSLPISCEKIAELSEKNIKIDFQNIYHSIEKSMEEIILEVQHTLITNDNTYKIIKEFKEKKQLKIIRSTYYRDGTYGITIKIKEDILYLLKNHCENIQLNTN